MTDLGVDVLVVGAGPVGLTAAHELARRGVRVRVIDAAAGPATTSRALATHARTLEIYDQMGLADRILPRGQRVEHFTLHSGGRRLIRFDTDYSRLPTRYPFTLMVDQVITEEVLRDAVAGYGVPVEWGVQLVHLRQDDDAVHAVLRHADGTITNATVPWLIGCDGGHSAVRSQLRLELAGDSTETWLIADATIDVDLPPDSIHWMHTGDGTVMLVPFPEPGRWRLLDTADIGTGGGPEQVASRFAAKITKATGLPATVHRPSWISVFTIQQRMIEKMRSGRCLVAGDAAHVHSPASGQGMNTGIQDAYNLAWRLAMVVRGTAGPALLDGYSRERVPIGARLLTSTRVATALVALRNQLAPVLMPVGLGLVRRLPPVKSRIERKIMRGMSGLGLAYAPDRTDGVGQRVTLVGRADESDPGCAALVAALRDPRWTLLWWAPDRPAAAATAARESDWLSVRTVTPAAAAGDDLALADPTGRLGRALRAAAGDWLLIRPDGYLAARGRDLTEGVLREAADRYAVRPPVATVRGSR